VARSRPIRSASSFAKLTSRQREAYERTLDAIRRMRRGESASRAAKNAGTTTRAMRRYLGADLKRTARGRLKLTRDRAYRRMSVFTTSGVVDVDVSRREASIVGSHWSAIAYYGASQDDPRLQRFRGVSVGGYELETDIALINEAADRGELEFEDISPRQANGLRSVSGR
jgi:hypothetical protein